MFFSSPPLLHCDCLPVCSATFCVMEFFFWASINCPFLCLYSTKQAPIVERGGRRGRQIRDSLGQVEDPCGLFVSTRLDWTGAPIVNDGGLYPDTLGR